jgi:hypothetical protein
MRAEGPSDCRGSERVTGSAHDRRVDVLVPCAGDARYVGETLRSIQRQSLREIRVFVIDNACPHGRYAEATTALRDERFTYVRHDERLPMTLNWQRCLSHGQAPILAMVHDDDIWPQDYLEAGRTLLLHDETVLGVMTAVSLFEGANPAEASDSTVPDLCRIAELPNPVQRVHTFFSFLGHMSAFIGRRGPRGFPAASWWIPDQLFIDAHWLHGRCTFNTGTVVSVRRHTASVTLSLANDPVKAAEVRQRFRQNAMEIIRNDLPGRYDLPEFVRTADPKLLVAVCNACLQWPARGELHEFVRAVLRVPGAAERIRATGVRGKVLTSAPFWMITAGGMLRDGLIPSKGSWMPPNQMSA